MWQVYLFLANERRAIEQRQTATRRDTGASRIRRWRTPRRPSGSVPATGTRSEASAAH